MQRYASVIKVKEGMEEEYKRLHKAVWPEILKLIESCHIKNYSIYFRDGFLFNYYEYHGNDHDADIKRMRDTPRNKEWSALCMACQQTLDTIKPGEWEAPMEEVFHMD